MIVAFTKNKVSLPHIGQCLGKILLISIGLVLLTVGGISAQSDNSTEEDNYKITPKTLDNLSREGVPTDLVHALKPLINEVYTSRTKFIAALQDLKPPPKNSHVDLILQYSRLDKLKVMAEEFSGDLSQGEVIFKGNVNGEMPRDNIRFSTAKLRILTGENNSYERLIAEGKVEIYHEDRHLKADYTIYNHVSRTLHLKGNLYLSSEYGVITGFSATVDMANEWASIQGNASAQKDGRVKMDLDLKDTMIHSESAQETSSKVNLQAQQVTVDKVRRRAVLEGQVEMFREQEQLYLKGGKLTLNVNEAQQVESVRGEQSICIEQPGRVAKADTAYFDEKKQTILLEGNAEVHAGQYNLKGNTINLFLDVNKGEAQGDNKVPIQMTISLDAFKDNKPKPKPFRCR